MTNYEACKKDEIFKEQSVRLFNKLSEYIEFVARYFDISKEEAWNKYYRESNQVIKLNVVE